MRVIQPRSYESDRQLLNDSQYRQAKTASSVLEMQEELEATYDSRMKRKKLQISLYTLMAVGGIFLGVGMANRFLRVAVMAIGGLTLLGTAMSLVGLSKTAKEDRKSNEEFKKLLTSKEVGDQSDPELKEVQKKSAKMAIDIMQKTRMIDSTTLDAKRRELQTTRLPISSDIKQAVLE